MTPRSAMAPARLGVLAALVIVNYLICVLVASTALCLLADDLSRWLTVLRISLLCEDGAGRTVAACCAFVALTQGAFLLPTFSPLVAGGGPRSLRWTTTAAAGMAAAFTVAWVLALVTTLMLYLPPMPGGTVSVVLVVLGGAFIASWCYWGSIFFRSATASSVPELHLMRKVFGATGILVAATIPLDILTRRKSHCYCGEGSLIALCWGLGGAVWLLGPWLLRHRITRVRHELSVAYCMRCGHARGPSPAPVCPECGHRLVTPVSPRSDG